MEQDPSIQKIKDSTPVQTIQLIDPSSQPFQYTIFINNCNGYVGSQLIQTFRNDHLIQVNPNIIIGTIDSTDATQSPEGVEIFEQKTGFNTAINNSDIIIFEIEWNRSEFQYIIKLVKYLRTERKKTIICISNFQSWNSNENEQISLKKRNGSDDYLRQLQNLCFDIQHTNPQIKGYVVSKGIVYGQGEKSILSSSIGLSVLGDGSNLIPMIHVLDLCQIVHHIAFNDPKQRHFIASDGANSAQHQIMKAISDNLGEGIVNVRAIEDLSLFMVPDQFFLNLRTKKADVPINWHCEGFVGSIGSIVFQFNECRGIKTNKIYVGGMPVAGKTHIASILSKHYNLPLINIKQTVEFIKNHPSQLGQNINKILQQTRIKLVDEEQKIFEENKKKKKPKKGQPVEEFDPSKVVPKLSEQNLVKVFRARLEQQDCKNKGYVLDGYPKTSHQATELFKDAPDSLPNSGFYIQSTEEEVKERVKKMPLEVSKETHWNDEATLRRLGAHKTHIDGNKHILEFFKENKIDIKKIPFNHSQPKQQLISFVERNGSMGLTQAEPLLQPEEQAKIQNVAKQETVTKQSEEEELNIENLKANQRKILDEKSKPIRQYLIDNVIPQLTEGLIEICRQTPANPLDFLISFLESKQETSES